MTIPQFTQQEFIKYLATYGWEEKANTDWETHQRIVIGNGTDVATFQLKAVYFYPHVVKLCDSLGIPAPEDHRLCYDQVMNLKNRDAENEGEKE